MSNPENIPQDVLATAEERYLDAIVMTSEDEPKAIVLMIARAILAEREAAATRGGYAIAARHPILAQQVRLAIRRGTP